MDDLKTLVNAIKTQPTNRATSSKRGASEMENEERTMKLYGSFSPEIKKKLGKVKHVNS